MNTEDLCKMREGYAQQADVDAAALDTLLSIASISRSPKTRGLMGRWGQRVRNQAQACRDYAAAARGANKIDRRGH